VVVGKRPFPAHRKVGLDTNVLIYHVQDHPRYGKWCATLFARIERGQVSAVTSTVSMLEALVQPYRFDNHPLAPKFYALLSTYPRLNWVPVSLEVADRAAEFRARYNLSTPHAIQLATAISFQATGFIGNDKGLKKVKEIECMIVSDLV